MLLPGYILTVLVAYLLGSIPTGFLMAKARGVDIRTVGSGNIGATNAFRILGTGPGLFVLLMDALKGWLAVQAATQLVPLVVPGHTIGEPKVLFPKIEDDQIEAQEKTYKGQAKAEEPKKGPAVKPLAGGFR